MSNGSPLATAPLAYDHSAHVGPDHRCYECIQKEQIRSLLAERDLNRREVVRLDTELAKTRRQLALSEARRWTLEILRAIDAEDRQAWAHAMVEREKCCVSREDLEVIEREYARKEAA